MTFNHKFFICIVEVKCKNWCSRWDTYRKNYITFNREYKFNFISWYMTSKINRNGKRKERYQDTAEICKEGLENIVLKKDCSLHYRFLQVQYAMQFGEIASKKTQNIIRLIYFYTMETTKERYSESLRNHFRKECLNWVSKNDLYDRVVCALVEPISLWHASEALDYFDLMKLNDIQSNTMGY